jgi:hypothetical protein
MRRVKLSGEMRELMARAEAEDRTVNYIGTLPSPVRALVAANTAKRLLSRWEREWQERLLMGDQSKVFFCSADEIEEGRAQLDSIVASRSATDAAAEHHVDQLLAHLPTDDAALAAFNVARYEAAFG